jgi:tagatose-1,6-bisphosphate aldolase
MRTTDRRELIRQLIREMADEATPVGSEPSSELTVEVAAALLAESADELLVDAERLARSTQDRQFVAIAAAFVAGDHDRVDALARDHLIDHPSGPVLGWIVAHSRRALSGDPSSTMTRRRP